MATAAAVATAAATSTLVVTIFFLCLLQYKRSRLDHWTMWPKRFLKMTMMPNVLREHFSKKELLGRKRALSYPDKILESLDLKVNERLSIEAQIKKGAS